jgi:hypothetical protein
VSQGDQPLFLRANPELGAPAGGIRLPVAREFNKLERAGWVKAAAGAREAGRSEAESLDAAEHSSILGRAMG